MGPICPQRDCADARMCSGSGLSILRVLRTRAVENAYSCTVKMLPNLALMSCFHSDVRTKSQNLNVTRPYTQSCSSMCIQLTVTFQGRSYCLSTHSKTSAKVHKKGTKQRLQGIQTVSRLGLVPVLLPIHSVFLLHLPQLFLLLLHAGLQTERPASAEVSHLNVSRGHQWTKGCISQ